jgi:elongator complex protein 6
MDLRSRVHSSVLSCSADLPLISAATEVNAKHSPIEIACAAFLVQQAHNAFFTMSCRELATGAAKDVSGVLRITRGGAVYTDEAEDATAMANNAPQEIETLYLVNRDGSVRVFERGTESG